MIKNQEKCCHNSSSYAYDSENNHFEEHIIEQKCNECGLVITHNVGRVINRLFSDQKILEFIVEYKNKLGKEN